MMKRPDLVILCVIATFLFVSAYFVYFLRYVLPLSDNKQFFASNHRHPPFTTDELRYVLYGEGNVSLSPTDSRYLDHIRSLIARPSPARPRNIFSSGNNEIAFEVDRRLGFKQGGFFVECGAADGESWSNTLFLETERNWTGLLIEANRRYFKQILDINRQVYSFGGCLSPYRHPATLRFKSAGDQGGLRDFLGPLNGHIKLLRSFESLSQVYCVPLGDLLAALDVYHVDFLSLDVQGAELNILKTIDFSVFRIDVIVVEASSKRVADNIRKFFNNTGIYRPGIYKSNDDIMMERIDLDV